MYEYGKEMRLHGAGGSFWVRSSGARYDVCWQPNDLLDLLLHCMLVALTLEGQIIYKVHLQDYNVQSTIYNPQSTKCKGPSAIYNQRSIGVNVQLVQSDFNLVTE